jgi:SAM-dependent methyltransferase
VLEGTLGTRFVPGSNLKGDLAGANWWYLLPSLEAERVVCLGVPSRAALSTLSRASKEVVVCGTATSRSRALKRLERDFPGVRVARVARGQGLPLPDGCADVVAIVGRAWARRIGRDPFLLDHVAKALRPGGTVYVEFDRVAGSRGWRAVVERFGEPLLLRLGPATGEIRTAAPAGQLSAVSYLERRWLRRSFSRQVLRHPGRFATRHPLAGRLTRRRGIVVGLPSDRASRHPPPLPGALAGRAEIGLDGRSWAFSAPGAYNSQKVLYLLFDRQGERPEYIVKMTRDPAFNGRLENEWRALTLLAEQGIGDAETLPRPTFLGRHAGLAVLGETAVGGAPFLERTEATAQCSHARDAVEWLVDLAGATAGRPVGAAEAAVALGMLRSRFLELYTFDPGLRAFLADQIDNVAASPSEFPLVFQHGDPGCWNLVVTQSGRPGFLDWEAAEPNGMPLWDLFYFLRSYGVAVSRAAGTHDPTESFVRHYLEESDLGVMLVDAVRSVCERTRLDPALVEPLFYTCWMHRALKEATRLQPDRLESGTYVRLLRLCVARRDAPGLRRLFSLSL